MANVAHRAQIENRALGHLAGQHRPDHRRGLEDPPGQRGTLTGQCIRKPPSRERLR
jgi:hypothetical protein